ncbi:hypothetical protein AB834_01345 [PVC group bacterium (ex Bugula neritina AB1)]|nr:hypothetical protein AB834_01345 [PVC group bacterium (ex Bugula neritina AB1)]
MSKFKESNIDKIKTHLEQYLQEIGVPNPTKGNFRCLIPEHTDLSPSMSLNSKDPFKPYVKCFGCEFQGSLIDLHAKLNGLTDSDSVKDLEQRYIKSNDNSLPKVKGSKKSPVKVPVKKNVSPVASSGISIDELKRIHEKAKALFTKEIFEKYSLGTRAIPFDTLKTSGVGYLSNQDLKRIGYHYAREEGALVLPMSSHSLHLYYLDRESGSKYKILKADVSQNERFFNHEELFRDTDEPLFFCEGFWDALSFEFTDLKALPIGSVGKIRSLQAELLRVKDRLKRPLVFAFDSDSAGKKATVEMEEFCNKEGIFYDHFSLKGKKDPNELLHKSSALFSSAVDNTLKRVKKEYSQFNMKKLEKNINTENEINQIKSLSEEPINEDELKNLQDKIQKIRLRYPDYWKVEKAKSTESLIKISIKNKQLELKITADAEKVGNTIKKVTDTEGVGKLFYLQARKESDPPITKMNRMLMYKFLVCFLEGKILYYREKEDTPKVNTIFVCEENSMLWFPIAESDFYRIFQSFSRELLQKYKDITLDHTSKVFFDEENLLLATDFISTTKRLLKDFIDTLPKSLEYCKYFKSDFPIMDVFNKKNRLDRVETQNHLIVVKEGKIIESQPSNYSLDENTVKCKLNLDKSREVYPKRFIEELLFPVLEEKDDIEVILKYFAMCLTGENKHQKILVLAGEAGSGKSVLASILKALMGGSVKAFSPQSMESQFEMGNILSQKIILSEDVDPQFWKHKNISFLKTISSDGVHRYEQKNAKEPIDAHGRTMPMVFTTNFKKDIIPFNRADSEAYARRFLFVYFSQPQYDKPIVNLAKKIIKEELEDILELVLRFVPLLEEEGFSETAYMRERIMKAMGTSCAVINWIKDNFQYCEESLELKRGFSSRSLLRMFREENPSFDKSDMHFYKQMKNGIQSYFEDVKFTNHFYDKNLKDKDKGKGYFGLIPKRKITKLKSH